MDVTGNGSPFSVDMVPERLGYPHDLAVDASDPIGVGALDVANAGMMM